MKANPVKTLKSVPARERAELRALAVTLSSRQTPTRQPHPAL
jgi:hypothetical protein